MKGHAVSDKATSQITKKKKGSFDGQWREKNLGFVHQRAGDDVHNTSIAASAFIRLWPQTP